MLKNHEKELMQSIKLFLDNMINFTTKAGNIFALKDIIKTAKIADFLIKNLVEGQYWTWAVIQLRFRI